VARVTTQEGPAWAGPVGHQATVVREARRKCGHQAMADREAHPRCGHLKGAVAIRVVAPAGPLAVVAVAEAVVTTAAAVVVETETLHACWHA